MAAFKGGKEKGDGGERPQVWVTCRTVPLFTFRLVSATILWQMSGSLFTVTFREGRGAGVGALCRELWPERIMKLKQE